MSWDVYIDTMTLCSQPCLLFFNFETIYSMLIFYSTAQRSEQYYDYIENKILTKASSFALAGFRCLEFSAGSERPFTFIFSKYLEKI